MPDSKRERRRNVRLASKHSGAGGFKCGKCTTLPPQALVADVSESGVRLLFDWPEGADFPLRIGDGMGFQLKVEHAPEAFELWSLVRRVEPRDQRGHVGVGVEFTGLEPAVREVLQKALVSLAMTKLRTWSPDGRTAFGPDAPGDTRSGTKDAADVAAGAPAVAGKAPADAAAKAPAAPPRRKLFLGEIMVKQGTLDPERFDRFLKSEFSGKRQLGQELLKRGLTTEAAIARALAEQARLPYADPAVTSPDRALTYRLPRPALLKHRCVPLREEGRALVVAMASPPDLREMEQLREALGRIVRVCIAPEPAVVEWRKQLFSEELAAAGDLHFPAQLRTEYRFMDRDNLTAVDLEASVGLTREISARGLVLAGPLPGGVTPERIKGEGLRLAVLIDCTSLKAPMNLACTPLKVEPGKVGGEHLICCQIEEFLDARESDWARVCMVHGTHRFHPQIGAR
jgi:hypothetical protein